MQQQQQQQQLRQQRRNNSILDAFFHFMETTHFGHAFYALRSYQKPIRINSFWYAKNNCMHIHKEKKCIANRNKKEVERALTFNRCMYAVIKKKKKKSYRILFFFVGKGRENPEKRKNKNQKWQVKYLSVCNFFIFIWRRRNTWRKSLFFRWTQSSAFIRPHISANNYYE